MLEVKVVPQSGRVALVLDKSGILKCFVKAAPEKGKANQEVVEIVAKTIGVARGSVEIVSGLTSRKKLIRVQTDLTYEGFLNLIGAGIQGSIT